jgi:C-terminal processing protease CtpA/Prc
MRRKEHSSMRSVFIAFLGCLALNGSPAAHAQTGGTSSACGGIGVQVRPMTMPFAKSLGMATIHGAIFDHPKAGGPAARSGIQAGDVVTAINGRPLMNSREFAPAIAAFAPNTRITLNTRRSNQLIIVQVTLGAAKCPPAKARRSGGAA